MGKPRRKGKRSVELAIDRTERLIAWLKHCQGMCADEEKHGLIWISIGDGVAWCHRIIALLRPLTQRELGKRERGKP